MQYLAFLSIRGQQQGLISAGASSQDSIGHNWQENEDVIRVYGLSHQLSQTAGLREHKPFVFTKEIDKASPLLRYAMTRGERLNECELKLYRISPTADYEHFLTIILNDALVAGACFEPRNRKNLRKPLREKITLRYRKIQFRHEISSTYVSDIWDNEIQASSDAKPINEKFAFRGFDYGNPANFTDTTPDWMKAQTKKTVVQEKSEPVPSDPVSEPEPEPKPEPLRENAESEQSEPAPKLCTFAKSCDLPDGVIDHPDDKPKPVEPVKNYGSFAVMAGALGNAKGISSLSALPNSASISTLFGDLRLGLRIGASALQGAATTVSTTALGVLGLLWSPKLGDGEIHYTEDELRQMSQARTRARMNFQTGSDGIIKGYGLYTGDNPEWEMVDVINVRSVGSEMVADLGDGIEVVWTPQADPADAPTTPPLEADYQAPDVYIYPTAEQAAQVYENPAIPTDYKDAILVFPADSGIPPLYVVFKAGARYEPGVVTGHGEDITGIWLKAASKGLGAPVPSSIADKLRGREFADFSQFREAFWLAVSEDEHLLSQFKASNRTNIKDGLAPFVIPTERVGGRIKFEIHHIEEIQYGGPVYDIDNLHVVTPKNHIRIHSKR